MANERILVAEGEMVLATEIRKRHTAQLRGLNEATLTINAAPSLDVMLKVVTEKACEIVGAHQSVAGMTANLNWSEAVTASSFSDKYAAWRACPLKLDGSGLYVPVCRANKLMRLTEAEHQAYPLASGVLTEAAECLPLRGYLAAPLTGHKGENIGFIQVSDKFEGEFTEEDEAILTQLARVVSVAIENARLYRAEEAARLEAEKASRAKDAFLALVSHELRTPLTAILGWARMLRTGNLDAALFDRGLETIARNANVQAKIIEDLLDISRIVTGTLRLNKRPTHLATLVEAAINIIRPTAEAKIISIEFVSDDRAGWVSGDPARLQQVIWNLLSNAVKFTLQRGRIYVRLDHGLDQARITVRDTGQGIRAEFLPTIFDRFRQADGSADRKFTSLGLGLALVRHLAELHGGAVHAESPGEGQGATFTVCLPLLTDVGASDRRPALPVTESRMVLNKLPTLDGVRVLVVDDEADARAFVTQTLQQCGAQVLALASAREALGALEQWQPHVLVSDIGMPQENGYVLIRKVRALKPEQGGQIPAVALTAYGRSEDRQHALSSGYQMHVPKPVAPSELAAIVAGLVR